MISFAYTTPAFLARRKTVTRRDWDDDYARSFMVGRVFSAFDKQPRFGGVRIGRARVVAIDKQPLVQMPDSDYEAEGFAYLAEIGTKPSRSCPLQPSFDMAAFRRWRFSGGVLWVVRFEILEAEIVGQIDFGQSRT